MKHDTSQYPVSGAGLGLRRALADKLMADPPADIDFMEVAPENWIHVGGALGRKLRWFTERYPFRHPWPVAVDRLTGATGRATGTRHQAVHGGPQHPHVLGAPQCERRRRPPLRPDAHSVHGGRGALRCSPDTPCAGYSRAAHRDGKRFLLHANRQLDERSRLSAGRAAGSRLRSDARYQQHCRQQHQSWLRRTRISAAHAGRTAALFSPGRAFC